MGNRTAITDRKPNEPYPILNINVDSNQLQAPLPTEDQCTALIAEVNYEVRSLYAFGGTDDVFWEINKVLTIHNDYAYRYVNEDVKQLVINGEVFNRGDIDLDHTLGRFLKTRLETMHIAFMVLIDIPEEGAVWYAGMFLRNRENSLFCAMHMSETYIKTVTLDPGETGTIDLNQLRLARDDIIQTVANDITPDLARLFRNELTVINEEFVKAIKINPQLNPITISYARPVAKEWEDVNLTLFTIFLHSAFKRRTDAPQSHHVVYKPELDWIELTINL